MIEKGGAVEHMDEILSIPGVAMIKWGPADCTMSIGRACESGPPESKATERCVIETAVNMGIPPCAEIGSVDQVKYYLDLGVRHFCLGTDIGILFDWWK